MFVVATQAATESHVVEVTALVIALYGAIVATIVAVQGLRADRASVFVSHGWSYSVDDFVRPGHPQPHELLLTAVNSGRRDVVVRSLGLEIPGLGAVVSPEFVESTLIQEDGRLQFLPQKAAESRPQERYRRNDRRLTPGEKMELRFDAEELGRLLDQMHRHRGVGTGRVRAVLEDTTENRYCGSWFEIREDIPRRQPEEESG